MIFMRQRGNILFLILLAVVLFAALSYAVTSSMRGGGKDASSESNQAAASAIAQFFQQIDTAVMRLTLAGGNRIENISFERDVPRVNAASAAADVNPNCTSNACKIFHVDGGGVAPMTFEKYAVSPAGFGTGSYAPGVFDVQMIQWPFAGTDANDVTIRILNLKIPVCTEIAKLLNIPNGAGVTGTAPGVTPVSGWDSSVRTIINPERYLDKNAFLMIGADNCHVVHLIYAR